MKKILFLTAFVLLSIAGYAQNNVSLTGTYRVNVEGTGSTDMYMYVKRANGTSGGAIATFPNYAYGFIFTSSSFSSIPKDEIITIEFAPASRTIRGVSGYYAGITVTYWDQYRCIVQAPASTIEGMLKSSISFVILRMY